MRKRKPDNKLRIGDEVLMGKLLGKIINTDHYVNVITGKKDKFFVVDFKYTVAECEEHELKKPSKLEKALQ